MPTPRDTLWTLEEHSKAKHLILRSYLSAWLPIMSKWNPRLVLVDGFAGPGRYTKGEDGSPLVMLKAFLEHNQRHLITAELVYLFIEEREDRAAHFTESGKDSFATSSTLRHGKIVRVKWFGTRQQDALEAAGLSE